MMGDNREFTSIMKGYGWFYGKIELTLRRYFAGLGYDGYSVKLPEEGMINMRISKNVLKEPKPEELKVTLEREDSTDLVGKE
jgi:hypothetical protein